MHNSDLGQTDREPWDGLRPGPPDDLVRHARRRLISSLGWGALVAALTAQAVVVLMAPTLDAAGSRSGLLLGCTLAQLPVLAFVLATCCCRSRRRLMTLGTVVELGSRAEHAEAALRREHDRLHELRATLAAVSASYQMLRDPRTKITPGRRDRLLRLHDAEMGRLERLLADRQEPVGEVDLDAVIDPLVESLRVRGHEVSWTETGCRVHGRRDDVTEAVHVLLENAGRHAAGRSVDVAVVPRGQEVDVRVTDHGPGVAPEVLPRLFARGACGPGSPGAGLGLNIARRLAQETGGRLRLEPPRPGEPGAAFVLTLPAYSGRASCLAAPA
jgi:signal transduction histidine kinase